MLAFQGAAQSGGDARIVGVEQAIHHGQAQVVVTAVQRQQPRFQAAGGIESGQLFQGVAACFRVGGVDRATGQIGGAGIAGRGQSQQTVEGIAAKIGGIHVQGQGQRLQRLARMQFGQRVQRRLPHQMMRIAQSLAQHRQHGFPADGGLRGQRREAGDAVAPHPLVIIRSLGDGRLPDQAGVSPERESPQFGRAGSVLLVGGSAPAAGEAQNGQQALGGGTARLLWLALKQTAYPAGFALQPRFGFGRGLRRRLIGGDFGQTLRLAPEGFRLRAQAENLGGGVSPGRGVAGQGVDHGVQQARPLRRLRPVAHVAGFLGLAWPDQFQTPLPQVFIVQPCFQHASGGKADFRLSGAQGAEQQIRLQLGPRQGDIAGHDHREGQFLEIALGILQALQQALHAIAAERDEAVERAAPDRQMLVALGSGQHRNRPYISQLR